jgi:hypothetical protein|tara:strand:+ start:1382 stop:1600 length:219 start_codon:yes stop_codon:yes gene_type:complete
MKYVIFEMINANLIDFSLVEETSLETLRLSLDTTKCILKFKGETPAFLVGLQEYNQQEILQITSNSDWYKDE